MKVLIQGRADISSKPGGDYFSIKDKIELLRDLDVKTEFNSDPKADLSMYDLVHIHQSILNTYNVKLQLDNAIKWRKPVIFKPFYNPLIDTSYYLKYGQTPFIRNLYKLINNYLIYLKARNVFYSIYNGEPIKALKQIILNIQHEQIRIIKNTFIIPDSMFELNMIKEDITKKVINYNIVNVSFNASEELINVDRREFSKKYGLSDFVLCVGRIEPLKNQVNLLEAMIGQKIDIVIEGGMQPYHYSYNEKFKYLIRSNKNFHWIGGKENRRMLFSAYKNAKVVVIPSWTETAGMTGIEGGYFDCNIAATERGACKEYFKESAWYLDPNDQESIRTSVLEAYNSPKGCRSFKERILSDYSLDKTSKDLANAYYSAINIIDRHFIL